MFKSTATKTTTTNKTVAAVIKNKYFMFGGKNPFRGIDGHLKFRK